MKPNDPRERSKSYKLHRRYTPLVFAFLMATIMALLMCSTIVAAQTGFHSGYWSHVFSVYALAMPAAFCSVLVVRPIVMRLITHIVDI